jgi:hypothetical protein
MSQAGFLIRSVRTGFPLLCRACLAGRQGRSCFFSVPGEVGKIKKCPRYSEVAEKVL